MHKVEIVESERFGYCAQAVCVECSFIGTAHYERDQHGERMPAQAAYDAARREAAGHNA